MVCPMRNYGINLDQIGVFKDRIFSDIRFSKEKVSVSVLLLVVICTPTACLTILQCFGLPTVVIQCRKICNVFRQSGVSIL